MELRDSIAIRANQDRVSERDEVTYMLRGRKYGVVCSWSIIGKSSPIETNWSTRVTHLIISRI